MELTPDYLDEVYRWIDSVPLSRPKKNIARDFSDGSQMAKIIEYYLWPNQKQIIQVHNYIETFSIHIKQDNWDRLNSKVLIKFNKF